MSVSSFNTAADSEAAYAALPNQNNNPYNAAQDSQAAYAAMPNAGLSGSTGAAGPLISNSTGAGQFLGQYIPPTINQTERLFTTRSRNINFLNGGGNRGQHTYIRLLTSNASTSLQQHLSSATYSPTSLGTNTSGPLADAINGNSTTLGYASFLLTDIGGSFDEKVQVQEVYGDAEVTYYFGRQPISMQFGGVLIDSPDNNWFLQWIEMYANALRGSQLARNYELVKIVTPNLTLTGTITNMSWNQNAARDVDIPFRFTLLCKTVTPNPVIPTGAPLSSGSTNLIQSAQFATQSVVNSTKLIANLQSAIQNPTTSVSSLAQAMRSVGVLGSQVTGAGIPSIGTVSGISGAASALPGIINNISMTGSVKGSIPAITSLANSLFGGTNSIGTGGGTVNTSSSSGANTSIFATVSSNLAGIQAGLYSPVVGVVSSLTKLISSAGGNAASVTSTFPTALQNQVAGATSISSQASGIINLANGKGASVAVPGVSDPSLLSTIGSLQNTSGCITSAPQSVTSNISGLMSTGNMNPNSALNFANSSGVSVSALLNSGSTYTALSGASI